MAEHLSYGDIYRNLDGMIAMATAAATPLRKAKDEMDTAFVKRIVATYLSLASWDGVHRAALASPDDKDRKFRITSYPSKLMGEGPKPDDKKEG